ncbi:MAG TPA: copper resistance protein CopC [bacterium]|nr:copper resistance protein CopC [bacterium]
MLGVVLGRAPVALAHAALLRADPADLCLLPGGESLPADTAVCRTGTVLSEAPKSVELLFSEPVQPIGRGLRVVGPDGRRVDHGAVSVIGARVGVAVDAHPVGTYRVVWSVISPDTHPEFGTMAFSVRQPGGIVAGTAPVSGTPGAWGTALGALAHVLHFAGYALGFGVFAAAWLAGEGGAAPEPVWRALGIGIVLLLAAEPVALVAESLSLGALSGADPAVMGAVLDSSFGRVLAQRLAAPILLWVFSGAIRSGALRAAWTVPLLGVALAFIDGEAAHAAGAHPAWWGFGVNTVHVCAMGLWAGTLAFVMLPRSAPRSSQAWRISSRVVAPAAIAAAAATGTVMAFQHLAGLRDLVANPYGRTLAVKVGAVIAAAVFGWLGVRGSVPRLLRWEAAALLIVLALAGLLVLQRPPVP